MRIKEKKTAGLYVHIPFCVRKCAYCDFLSAPGNKEEKERYVELLCEEIEQEAGHYPGYRGETVFFGGGTPTTLRPEQLEKIMDKLMSCFSVNVQRKAEEAAAPENTAEETGQTGIFGIKAEEPEITLECNPGTVSREDLRKLRKAGFNRLSIGLQSARDEELKKLGRIHSWEDFLETYHAAREAGFRNINVDIMSALPGQSTESYKDTLRKVLELRPEHISAYSLIIEEGTPFYERYGAADEERRRYGEDKEHLLPSEEEERQMYELTEEMSAGRGYRRYEISNYALPGYECRHNITYWKRGNYLGFGPGAASLMENCRFTKSRDMEAYAKAVRCDTEGPKKNVAFNGQHLSEQEQMEEFMFLGLRMMEGISAEEFQQYFHTPIDAVYGDVLKKLEEQKLLTRAEDRIFLTKRGIDVSNAVLAEFLLQ